MPDALVKTMPQHEVYAHLSVFVFSELPLAVVHASQATAKQAG